ncbi:LysR family transcriptional regulator [Gluconacetobacter aggeris]|uniref:LysR family transcriptional regulator n=3 Tax=Gluconacetobacter TaxID=89583 RepID=A0A7W4IVR4_9PROT|nr:MULTISPECIES: LysR family transcriptional regulator [Gluconacetobacter]MBB2169848.1 LysR family transcriptional regulator [Gluconacetobacter aggeris]MBB2171786.1 LysR family transcriptional regulator [Gluconacetobacter asukensis]MBB2181122.1 LysR family transcriptional regulator [Gluconacetobacter tumulicola]
MDTIQSFDRCLDARFLQCVLEVTRLGSVRDAARSLGLPASLISRKISDAEIRYGVPLFERTVRGIIPTETGMVIAEYARQQMDENKKLLAYLSNQKRHRIHQISVHCGDGFVEDLTDRAVLPFSDRHPGIRVRVTVGSTDDIRQAVSDGVSEIGLSYNMEDFNGINMILHTHKPLYAILSAQDAQSAGSHMTIEDILDRKLALPTRSHGIRKLLKSIEVNHGVHIFPELESNAFRILKRFVLSGRGITFLPVFAVRAEIDAGTLVALPIENRLCTEASVHLFTRAQPNISLPVQQFVAFMRERLESLSNGNTAPQAVA